MYRTPLDLALLTERMKQFMKYPRIHLCTIKVRFTMRPHKIVGLVEADGRRIPGENVKDNGDATFSQSLALRSLHQLACETFAAMVYSYIQRDDVTDSPLLRLLNMQDHKAHECMVFVCYHYARFPRLCKAPHRAAGEAERFLEADHIECVHRVEVGGAIGT
jgi:hypothetical protein